MNDKTKKYMTTELLFSLDNIKLTEHLRYKIRKFYENSFIIFLIHTSVTIVEHYMPHFHEIFVSLGTDNTLNPLLVSLQKCTQ